MFYFGKALVLGYGLFPSLLYFPWEIKAAFQGEAAVLSWWLCHKCLKNSDTNF